MKKTLSILLLTFVMVSCTSKNKGNTTKPITQSIPSADKLVKEGTPLNSKYSAQPVSSIADAGTVDPPKEYTLLERLYDTVWYQTEKDYDDGKLEVETEFVFFNNNSWIVEREMENGNMDKVEADDYSQLVFIKSLDTASNSMIVENRAVGDTVEYEGYWLQDSHNLFIVESDSAAGAEALLKLVMAQPNVSEFLDTEHYLLSTNSGK